MTSPQHDEDRDDARVRIVDAAATCSAITARRR